LLHIIPSQLLLVVVQHLLLFFRNLLLFDLSFLSPCQYRLLNLAHIYLIIFYLINQIN
jgi:hypothetical protein